jgi:hypothetical protein
VLRVSSDKKGDVVPITDPTAARLLVYNVVVNWVASAVGLSGRQLDVSKTFMGAPTGGYGFNEGRFLQMCDQITVTLSNSSGRSLRLSGALRVSNEADDIQTFINNAALALIAAPLTRTGRAAHAWVMRN